MWTPSQLKTSPERGRFTGSRKASTSSCTRIWYSWYEMPPIPVRLVMLMMCLEKSWRIPGFQSSRSTVQDDFFKKKNVLFENANDEKCTKQIETVQGDVPASFDSKIPLQRCSKHHRKLIEIAYSRGGVWWCLMVLGVRWHSSKTCGFLNLPSQIQDADNPRSWGSRYLF